MDAFLKKIHWLGHASFRVDVHKIIYLDPFELRKGPKADLIFISHDHYDHCSPGDVEKIKGPNTWIITEKDSAKKLKGNIKVVSPGDELELEGIRIRILPAYNQKKDFHPKSKGWIGFLLHVEGHTLYHTGDSDLIPEMEGLRPDVALLPVSGTYVMDADMASEAAIKIQPRVVIPMHYGSFIGDLEDARRLKKALEGKIEVRILPREA